MLPLAALRGQSRRLALHADDIARAKFIGLDRIQREDQIKRRDFCDRRRLGADFIAGFDLDQACRPRPFAIEPD